MGNTCCGFGDIGDTTPNPRTGISAKDIILLRRSWTKLLKNSEAFVTLFYKLMAEHPYQSKWFDHHVISKQELGWQEDRLGVDMLVFVRTVDNLIEFADVPDIMIGMMEKIARGHINQKVSKETMDQLIETMRVAIRDLPASNNRWAEEIEMAWVRFFKVFTTAFTRIEENVNKVLEYDYR